MNTIVSLVKTPSTPEGIKNAISESVNLTNFELDHPVNSVVIKPNMCYYWDAATGQTTDPQIVSAIIDFVREKYGTDVDIKVAEADASAMRTNYAFTVLNYDKLAEEKNIELLNLSKGHLEEKTITINKQELKFQVPQILMNCDLFINVPKLKIMRETKITCAMKNLFGAIGFPRKAIYHKHLEEAIVGINRFLKPHLTIVDGLIALGRFPVKLGLIMASVDPFAIDWIASQILGYTPSKVRFLKLAIQDGNKNPREIVTKGASIAEFRKQLQKPAFTSSPYLFGIQSWMLKTYCKLARDVIPPGLDKD